jgi:hypothetical protein
LCADSRPADSGAVETDLAANADIELTQALNAIDLASGVTLDGAGETLDGGGPYAGLIVASGDVTIQYLTLSDLHAQGGGGFGHHWRHSAAPAALAADLPLIGVSA